jgi:hypothetical protein
MPTTEEILDSIENRLRDLNAEIDTLAAARAALDPRSGARPARRRRSPIVTPNGQAAPAAPADHVADATAADQDAISANQDADATAPESPPAPTSPRPRTVRRSSRGGRGRKSGRAVQVVAAGKLELLLSQANGATTSELVEQTNGDRDQVLVLLRELEAAGRVRRSGQRRGTRWHAITDEERIAERAAELAALSKPTE